MTLQRGGDGHGRDQIAPIGRPHNLISGTMLHITPEYQTVAVIVNPRAKRVRSFPTFQRRLMTIFRDLEIEAEWFITDDSGHATEIARDIRSRHEFDLVLVVGGDGTVNEVINAWIDHPVPIAVLPMGTSNILARVHGIRGSLEAMCIRIFYGHPRPIPVARANDRYFVLMCGAGFDAEVLRATTPEQKFRWNRLAYTWHAIRLGLRGCAYRINVHENCQNGDTPPPVRMVIVTLVNNYGGFFRILPRRWLKRAPMWWLGFRNGRAWHYIKYAVTALTGLHVRLPDVIVRPVNGRIRLEPNDASVPYQVDGELAGSGPVNIAYVGERIRLVVPAR